MSSLSRNYVWLRWLLIVLMALPLSLLPAIFSENAAYADALCDPNNPNDPDSPEAPTLPTCPAPDSPGIAAGGAERPALTRDPIHLARGAVIESEIDLALPGASFDWSHSRTYDSLLTTVAQSEVNTSMGPRWQATSTGGAFLSAAADGGIEVFTNQSSKRLFKLVNGSFQAPSDYNATLKKTNAGGSSEKYTLTESDTGRVYVFYGLHVSISSYKRGKLFERTTRALQADGKTGTTFTYNSSGFLTDIVTSEPQTRSVKYHYISSGFESGRLERVELKDENNSVIAKAEYIYAAGVPGVTGLASHLGYWGDLVEVKVSRKISHPTGVTANDWEVRHTHYRYYPGIVADGRHHQVKMVLESDAIDRIVNAGNSSVDTVAEILTKSDSFVVANGKTIADYASRSFTYYTSDLNTANSVTTPWGSENLQTKYGGTNHIEFENWLPGGHVKTETINVGCGGCGGTNGGLKKTYHYLSLNGGDSTDSSVVVRIVIEDTEDGDGAEIRRKICGLNSSGVLLREALIENVVSGTPDAWCRSKILNSDNRVIEERSPSAHDVVDSNSDIKLFLNPTSGSNDTLTQNSSAGIIHVYGYNADGYRTDTKIKQGRSGTAYYLSATDYETYGKNGAVYVLPKASYVHRTQSTVRNSGVKTSYDYTFWNTNETVVKKKTTTLPIVSTAQNGSGTATVEEEYFDQLGRLCWTKDGEGYIDYIACHPEYGQPALVIEDINPASPGSDVQNGDNSGAGGVDAKWDAWDAYGASTNKPVRDGSLATPIAETVKIEYDSQARLFKTIDDRGSKHYVVYENNRTLSFPYFNGSQSGLPISVVKTNDGDQTIETYTVRADYSNITTSNSEPVWFSSEPSQSDYTTLMRYFYAPVSGRQAKILAYHDIPSSGNGSHVTNYYVTASDYDAQGRVNATIQTSTATVHQVTQYIYDFQDRLLEAKSGAINSSIDTSANGDLGTLSLTGLTRIASQVYDYGSVGDSLVTSQKKYYGIGTNDYLETQPQYTWRYFVRGTIQKNGPTDIGPYQLSDVDWLGRTVATATYTAAPVWSSFITDTDYVATTSTNRHDMTKMLYDDWGQVYRTLVYPDVQGTKYSQANVYHDRLGRPVGSQQLYGMAAEVAYDGIGRAYQSRSVTSLESTRYTSGKFNYRSPVPHPSLSSMNGGDDKVVTLSHTEYDDNLGGLVIGKHQFTQRHDGIDGIDLSNDDDYIRTTQYVWHDSQDRLTHVASYGSGNGGGANQWRYSSVPTRPGTPPTSTAAVLVNNQTYNPLTGWPETSTDPLGRSVKQFFDDAQRQTFVSENHSNFVPTNIANTIGGGTENDQDRVTGFEYNGLDLVTSQTAYNQGQLDQVTKNLYEDSVSASRVTSMIYPDSNDTTSGGSDQVKYDYHVDGSLNTMTDQREVIHTYTYNTRRQQELDRITNLPGNVDGYVQSIKRTYDSLARVSKVTSYSGNNGNGTVRNEVQHTYNDHGRLSAEYQSHNGAVNTGSSWRVNYFYDQSTIGNIFDDQVRLRQLTYGSGKQIHFDYGSTSGLNDLLGRIQRVRENTTSGTVLAQYDYMGNNRLVKTDLVAAGFRSSDHLDDSDGIYEMLDRHGRMAGKFWFQYIGSFGYRDRFGYTYDRASNRLTKDIPNWIYAGNDQDQKFTFDGLDRLVKFEEGTLSGSSITSRKQEQQWDRDQLGNWDNFKERDTDTGSTWDLDQNRNHNKANEITSIASSPTHVDHDNAGNMTKVVKPNSNWSAHYDLKYDAWNRLVEVKDGSTVIQTCQYDGLNRRIVRDETGASGDKIHFYCSGHQVLEERKEIGGSEDADPKNVYFYHPHYIDALIGRDHDANTDGSSDRQYYFCDVTYNVTALVDDSQTILERYQYDPYGKVTILDADYSLDSDNISDYDNEYLFTSRRLDPKTGLYYFRTRCYSAELGRFLSRDPLGTIDGMNLYRGYFVPGGMDPLGLFYWSWNEYYCGPSIRMLFGENCVKKSFYHQSMGIAEENLTAIVNRGVDQLETLSYVDPTPLSGNLATGIGGYASGKTGEQIRNELIAENMPMPRIPGVRGARKVPKRNNPITVTRTPKTPKKTSGELPLSPDSKGTFYNPKLLCFVAGTPVTVPHGGKNKPVNIEEIRVGDRVVGQQTTAELTGETAVSPSTWRKLSLYGELLWDDGTVDDIHIETLQPDAWVQANHATVGSIVTIPDDLKEMGLPDSLKLKVESIQPCSPIVTGRGRVVLTTINHLNRAVCEVAVKSTSGRQDKIRATKFHKFFRVPDQSWVSACELESGDTLDGLGGQVTVQDVVSVSGTHRVYNMTVEGEHVFRVSNLGVLVHNNDCDEIRPQGKAGGPNPGHTPGKGHTRKSGPQKTKRFQKKAKKKKEQAQKDYEDAVRVWESMSEKARKLRPELNPENCKK